MKDLSLHILDIAHNSIRALATQISIIIHCNLQKDVLSISIEDNGSGMSVEQLACITDPFYTSRTTRKVGLGIPLLKQKAEECNGSLNIVSELEKGSLLRAKFQNSHIDLPELGDIAGVIAMLSCSFPQIRFTYSYSDSKRNYIYNTEDVKEALDGLSINTPEVEAFIREMIEENMKLE